MVGLLYMAIAVIFPHTMATIEGWEKFAREMGIEIPWYCYYPSSVWAVVLLFYVSFSVFLPFCFSLALRRPHLFRAMLKRMGQRLSQIYITYALISANILIFVWASLYPELIEQFCFRTIYILTGQRLYTALTSIFLHRDIVHLSTNLFFLLLGGLLIERRLGHLKFLSIFFLTDLIAHLPVFWLEASAPPLAWLYWAHNQKFGLSGAVYGIVGAIIPATIPAERTSREWMGFAFSISLYSLFFNHLFLKEILPILLSFSFSALRDSLYHISAFAVGLALSTAFKLKGRRN
jgi:membrane associated rhomboid family serine protease